jgi:hypothetical protein
MRFTGRLSLNGDPANVLKSVSWHIPLARTGRWARRFHKGS